MNIDDVNCPVCHDLRTQSFAKIGSKDYRNCEICAAIYLTARNLPSREEEMNQYLLHDNRIEDERYREFLSRLAQPLLSRLEPQQRGLDYGCGPGPALAHMMREAGHEVSLYDPFFYPDPAPLSAQYDFVTCTEVIEHFHRPATEFRRFDQMLRPNGWLALMTSFYDNDFVFEEWRYRRDPTHVVFYQEQTFRHLAAIYGWVCEIPVKNVALMRKVALPQRGRHDAGD